MTSPSRRKRPTTARAASLRARTWASRECSPLAPRAGFRSLRERTTLASLLVLGWLAAGTCHGQQDVAIAVPVQPGTGVREAAKATLPVRIDPWVSRVQKRQL